MGKTSPLTGTGKKAQKKLYKAQGTLAEMGVEQAKHDQKYRKSSQYDLRQLAKGKGLPSYEKMSLSDLQKDFERAGRGAEKIFAPIREEAIANFDQYQTPEIANQYGRESGAGSSALNQAMAAARGNLQRQLAADFSGIQANLAQNLLGQRESSRQFANQSQLQNVNARMQALGGGMGQTINPSFSPLQGSYNQKQGGSSGMGGTIVGGALGALGSYLGAGGTFGLGSAGATSAASAIPGMAINMLSSKEVKDNIIPYEKGLDIIRDLDVKRYDYTIPVEGRQTNRVGLIAEDVPQEIQAMIGDVKGVDVYGLVAVLVNCVKQLDEKVKLLEAA